MLAAAQIPWGEVIRLVPTVVMSARALWGGWDPPEKECAPDPDVPLAEQIAACVEQLHALESARSEQAFVVRQVALQLEDVAAGVAAVSRRSSMALWLGVGAMVICTASLAMLALIFVSR